MKIPNQRNTLKLLIVLLTFIVVTACNKQKAEAIKVAAEKFRVESISALDQIDFLFKQVNSIATNSDDQMIRIVEELNNDSVLNDFTPAKLNFLMTEKEITETPNIILLNKELDSIKRQYYRFESIFNSLDQGSYMAKDAVKKTEEYAIKLTVQLINFSKMIQGTPVIFIGQRSLLMERINNAKNEEDLLKREDIFTNIARDMNELRKKENKHKNETIIQCLKGAESGKLIAELIRDYDKLTINDMLASIKNSLVYASAITSDNETISNLLIRYEGVESAIRVDPQWSAVLDTEIN